MPYRLDLLDERLKAIYARPLLLIVGAPESGFDAVRAVLDAHPQVRSAPDIHVTDRFASPLKDVLGDYNAALEAAGAPAFTQGDFLYLVRTAMALSLAKLAPAEDVALIGCAAAVHAHNLDFWELMAPDLRVLHVVRDGRAATAAALSSLAPRPEGEAWYAAVDAAAYAWTDATRTACGFGAGRPDRYHEVRWEDLTAAPDLHLGAVLRFLELRSDAAALAACLERVPSPAAPAAPLDERAMGIVMKHQAPLLRQFEYLG